MGKSCLRYKRTADLDLVAEAVVRHDVDGFVELYERARAR